MLLDIMNREAEFFQLNNDLRNAQLIMEQNQLDLQSQLLELDYKIKQSKRKYDREKILRNKEIIPAEQYEDTKTEYEYLCRKKELTQRTFEQDCRFRKHQIKQIEASLERMAANLKIAKQKLDDLDH